MNTFCHIPPSPASPGFFNQREVAEAYAPETGGGISYRAVAPSCRYRILPSRPSTNNAHAPSLLRAVQPPGTASIQAALTPRAGRRI